MLCIFLGVLTEEQKNLVEQIFQTHHVRFINISFKIVKAESLANDAVATAYLKIMDNIEKVSELPCPQMTAFCVTIVKNASIDILRQSKRNAYMESLDIFADESSDNFEDTYIKKQNIQKLSELVNMLDEKDRYLIHMRYVQNMGYAEIGAMLGISEESAKKRGQRVVKKLKKLFERGE